MRDEELRGRENRAAIHLASRIPQPSTLVLRLSALGDVIHTIPAVVALRASGSAIAWVVEAPYRELVERVAGVRAIPVSLKAWGRAPLARRAEMAAARRALHGFDRAIDFQGLAKSALLAWLSRAPLRIGFDRDAIRETPALLFTNRHIAVDTSRHVVEQNLQLAGAAAAPDVDFSPFAADGPRFDGAVVLLPGAGKANKQWPLERFRELARRLGDRAVAVWGPGEEALANAIGCRVAPRTNLRELASVLRSAAIVIGGDTGPLHLAAALGTTVVGLYGPTNEKRNGPYGQLGNCISSFGGSKSMDAIAVDDVQQRLDKLQINAR
jgi:heptosyltransferase-1